MVDLDNLVENDPRALQLASYQMALLAAFGDTEKLQGLYDSMNTPSKGKSSIAGKALPVILAASMAAAGCAEEVKTHKRARRPVKKAVPVKKVKVAKAKPKPRRKSQYKLLVCGSSSFDPVKPYWRNVKINYREVRINNIARARAGMREIERKCKSELKRGNYDAVIVQGGVNSLWQQKPVRRSFGKMYQAAKKAGAKVIGVTLNPYKGYGSWKKKTHAAIKKTNKFVRGSKLVDCVIDMYKLANPSRDGRIDRRRTGDKLHLRSKYVQRGIEGCLRKLFRR